MRAAAPPAPVAQAPPRRAPAPAQSAAPAPTRPEATLPPIVSSPVDLWPALMKSAAGRTADRAALEALSLVESKPGTLALRLVDPSARALVKGRLAWIGARADELAGVPIAINVDGLEEERRDERDDDPAAAHQAMQDPLVRQAADLFDARVAGVRTRREPDEQGG